MLSTQQVRGLPVASPAAATPCHIKAFFGSRLPAATHRSQCRRAQSVTCSAAIAEAPAAKREFEQLGPDLWNKSYYPTGADAAALYKPWYIVDAEGKTLGRLAVLIASHLRGKHLPTYSPSVDMGGFVVVINAEKVQVTGSKGLQKLYKRHTTGRPGAMKEETFDQLQARIPERIIEKAVKGMLPRGRLGNALYRHLKVYAGGKHPHSAQQPEDITPQINLGPKAAAAARLSAQIV